MAYVKKNFIVDEDIKAWAFLVKNFNYSQKEAQRIIDRGQLFCKEEVVKQKSAFIRGNISLLVYEPKPKGLKPIFENEYFALFEKPSGVLTHPRNRNTEYSLNDEIKHLYGMRCNVVHRLDKDTSGLIVVSKNKDIESKLKTLFECREVEKSYIALVKGKIDKSILIDAPILINQNYESIKIKVYIGNGGKESQTFIKPIKYYEDIDATIIEATPKTGRQHQIRVHMFHVKHSIIGDMLYGQSAKVGADFLDGHIGEELRAELSGANRLLLHSNKIKFNFEGEEYEFQSQQDISEEFYKIAKEYYDKYKI